MIFCLRMEPHGKNKTGCGIQEILDVGSKWTSAKDFFMLFSFRDVHIDSNLNVPSLAGKKKSIHHHHTPASSQTDINQLISQVDAVMISFQPPFWIHPQSRWIPMLPRLLRHGLLRILKVTVKPQNSPRPPARHFPLSHPGCLIGISLKYINILKWFMRIPM